MNKQFDKPCLACPKCQDILHYDDSDSCFSCRSCSLNYPKHCVNGFHIIDFVSQDQDFTKGFSIAEDNAKYKYSINIPTTDYCRSVYGDFLRGAGDCTEGVRTTLLCRDTTYYFTITATIHEERVDFISSIKIVLETNRIQSQTKATASSMPCSNPRCTTASSTRKSTVRCTAAATLRTMGCSTDPGTVPVSLIR